MRHSLGLDEPLWRQYLLFLQHLFQGNLGESITYKQSTRTVIDERLPPTLFLVAYAATLGTHLLGACRRRLGAPPRRRVRPDARA